MKENSFTLWKNILLWANIGAMSIGILVAFAGNSFVFNLHNQGTEEIFFGGQELSPEVLQLKNWLFGIIGGTIAGYHMLAIYIINNAFIKKEKWAWDALLVGLLLWFIVDSSISIYYNALYNVYLINIVALIFIGMPLIATKKYFS
jgi:hypothetical protein